MSRVVAVFAAERADTDAAAEFLRVAAAFRAVGRDLSLVVAGPGVDALRPGAPRSPEADRTLELLRAEGIVPTPISLASLLGACVVLRLAPATRSGSPDVLRADVERAADLFSRPEALSAGQIAVS